MVRWVFRTVCGRLVSDGHLCITNTIFLRLRDSILGTRGDTTSTGRARQSSTVVRVPQCGGVVGAWCTLNQTSESPSVPLLRLYRIQIRAVQRLPHVRISICCATAHAEMVLDVPSFIPTDAVYTVSVCCGGRYALTPWVRLCVGGGNMPCGGGVRSTIARIHLGTRFAGGEPVETRGG